MKAQQCPACGRTLNLRLAVATKKTDSVFMLQCPNCQAWSYEDQKAVWVKTLGLLILLSGAGIGFFQFGGALLGPFIALVGGLIALLVKLLARRVVCNG